MRTDYENELRLKFSSIKPSESLTNMDREKRFCELDTEIEKWSDDEKHFVLWQLLKDYANKLDIPENANTLEEHKLMTFNHNLWVDCSELIDILNYELWR